MKIEKGQDVRVSQQLHTYSLQNLTNQSLKKEGNHAVEIQNETLELLSLFEQAKQQQHIRMEKVKEISTKIEKNEYNVTGRDVVLQLIGEMYVDRKNNRTV